MSNSLKIFESPRNVCAHLQCSESFLTSFLAIGPRSFYDELHIPKKNRRRLREYRRVFKVTNSTLAVAHKRLHDFLVAAYRPPEHVHGFVPGGSCYKNAKAHLGQRVVLHADIENFFGDISVDRIRLVFERMGCGAEAADVLSRLCTVDDALVPGASPSPVIANLVCLDLDADLVKLASATNTTVTRYCDDIVFSGDTVPAKAQIEAALGDHGFGLALDKYRWQKRGKAQYVTGVCVADPDRPRLPRRLKRWLRSVVHAAEKFGLDSLVLGQFGRRDEGAATEEVRRIDGCIAYAYSIEPRVAARLDQKWQPALKNSTFNIPLRRPGLYQPA